MLPGNEDLLKSFLGIRRIEATTKRGYLVALTNWDAHTGVELGSASGDDIERWFRNVSEAGLLSSSIFSYTGKLRPLHVYGLVKSGWKKRAAVAESGERWEVVPFRDLQRDDRHRMTLRDMIVTKEELNALLEGAHPRVQAYIALTMELGDRKSETLSLRIQDIKFGERYSTANVIGKTGERPLPIVYSLPYLRTWLTMHPDRRPEQWIFANVFRGEVRRLGTSTMNTTLRLRCIQKGIRHITPHMLRHTKLTELAEMGLGEFQMKQFAGWTPNSKMPQRYIHMSGRSHIPAVLLLQGIEVGKQDKKPPILESGRCPKCDSPVGPGLVACGTCGYVLVDQLRMKEPVDVNERLAAVEEILKTIGLAEQLKEKLRGAGSKEHHS